MEIISAEKLKKLKSEFPKLKISVLSVLSITMLLTIDSIIQSNIGMIFTTGFFSDVLFFDNVLFASLGALSGLTLLALLFYKKRVIISPKVALLVLSPLSLISVFLVIFVDVQSLVYGSRELLVFILAFSLSPLYVLVIKNLVKSGVFPTIFYLGIVCILRVGIFPILIYTNIYVNFAVMAICIIGLSVILFFEDPDSPKRSASHVHSNESIDISKSGLPIFLVLNLFLFGYIITSLGSTMVDTLHGYNSFLRIGISLIFGGAASLFVCLYQRLNFNLIFYAILLPLFSTGLVFIFSGYGVLEVGGGVIVTSVRALFYTATFAIFVYLARVSNLHWYWIGSVGLLGFFAGRALYCVFELSVLELSNSFEIYTVAMLVVAVLIYFYCIIFYSKNNMKNLWGSVKIEQNHYYEDGTEQACYVLAKQCSLSPREIDVLCKIARGKTMKLASQELFISENTVKMHSKNIYRKIGINKKQDLLIMVEEIVKSSVK